MKESFDEEENLLKSGQHPVFMCMDVCVCVRGVGAVEKCWRGVGVGVEGCWGVGGRHIET